MILFNLLKIHLAYWSRHDYRIFGRAYWLHWRLLRRFSLYYRAPAFIWLRYTVNILLIYWFTIFFFFTGYCFSASLPPVLTRAAYSAFDYIDDNSPKLCADLRTKCSELHSLIKNISKMEVISDKWSPVKYLVYPGCDTFDAYKSFANKVIITTNIYPNLFE